MEARSKNILLIEDNPDHAELARSALQTFCKRNGQDFQVCLIKNGHECIRTLSQSQYDAVVMDYSLPGTDGLSVLTKIRKKGIKIPVIMVTGRGDEQIAAEAIKKGASEYLPKDVRYLERLPWVVQTSIDDYERERERERMEEELQRYQLELEISKRLAILGEMASRIAHEIKNPLSKIKIGIDLLKRTLFQPDTSTAEVLKGVLDGVENLNKISMELLQYAKPSASSFQYLNLRNILETSVNDLKERIEHVGIRLVAKYHQGSTRLHVDGVKIKEVFLNLIENAVDAMPGGGTLTIESGWVEREGKPLLEISVGDTGEGIPEERLEKVFAPFFTTKSSGTGLGLAVVKKIMELHKGQVEIRSRIGEGTTVTIRLPKRKVLKGR